MIEGKKIIVTGGAGFLGSHIVAGLESANDVFVPRSSKYDLRIKDDVAQMFSDYKNVDIVIHAACDIGGIGYSSTHPGSQFYNNIIMNTYMVDGAYKAGIEKFVGIGSVCEYPADTPIPFKEEYLWNGYPVSTNDAYGLSKRMMLAQCNAYRLQYGFNSIHLLPVNLYGPKDDFSTGNCHVIPALIRKVKAAMDMGIKCVDVWGTGNESREFVYVEDVAKAVILATEKYDKPDPINIGSGKEITIRNLAILIKDIMSYEGEFNYLDNGLGGQQRRLLDVSKAKIEFGFQATTDFYDGMKKTIDYYTTNQHELDNH